MVERIGFDHAIAQIALVIVERSLDEFGVRQARDQAPIEARGDGTGRLMAVRTIGRQIGAHALLDADALIIETSQGAQAVQIIDGRAEVAGVVESADLIVDDATVIELAIKLKRVEAERQSTHRGGSVASQALTAAGVMPGLRVGATAVANHQGLIAAGLGHERGVGGGVPSVSDAVDAAAVIA